MEQEKEFKAGDEVTVDRYNAKGEEVKTKIERINPRFTGQDWWYVVLINGIEIQVRGGSIVESKYYNPVPDDQRHPPAYKGKFTQTS